MFPFYYLPLHPEILWWSWLKKKNVGGKHVSEHWCVSDHKYNPYSVQNTLQRLLSTIDASHAIWFFSFCLSCFCRHWVEHRYVLPHDAILQLRRASHLWARPQDLLPVRFQEVTGWSDKLSLESPAKSCGGGQRSREVRLLLTVMTPKSSLTLS